MLHFKQESGLELTDWGVFDAEGVYLQSVLERVQLDPFLPDGLFRID
jgi:hypothetical protein